MCNVYLKIPKKKYGEAYKKCVSANAVSSNKTKSKRFFKQKKLNNILLYRISQHAKKAIFSDNADYRAPDFEITNITV